MVRWTVLLLSLIIFTSRASADDVGFVPAGSKQAGGIVDLALIYQGGTTRIDWTQEQFASALSWTNPESGEEEWLFDGFLFLEIVQGEGYAFADGHAEKPARRTEWEWYLDRLYKPGLSLSALDAATSATVARIGQPPRPRRVVLTILEPIHEQEDWGRIGERGMDFSKPEDRSAAAIWFMEQLESRWNQAGFKHLELAGFYMVAEGIRPHDVPMSQAIGEAVRERGYRFYWIPYWGAPGSADWKELGFDIAYQQPNHFFHLNVPDSHLGKAIAFARRHGMGMELEWDARAIRKKGDYLPRFHSYMDAYAEAGVWDDAAVAHYYTHPLLIAIEEGDEDVQKAINRYRSILAQRQKKFAER